MQPRLVPHFSLVREKWRTAVEEVMSCTCVYVYIVTLLQRYASHSALKFDFVYKAVESVVVRISHLSSVLYCWEKSLNRLICNFWSVSVIAVVVSSASVLFLFVPRSPTIAASFSVAWFVSIVVKSTFSPSLEIDLSSSSSQWPYSSQYLQLTFLFFWIP